MTDEKEQPTKGPIAWMAGHTVAANLVMIFCLVGGIMALRSIKQEVFPDFEADSVRVSVQYPGASPEEVEEGIILPVEEAVEGVDGVDEISAVANENNGTVTIEAVSGTNIRTLTADIQSEVDSITTFPDEAEEPEVEPASFTRGVMHLVLYGDTDRTRLHELAEMTRDQLVQNEDITQVEVSGLPDLEIGIEVPQHNLRRYGLTLRDIADEIGRSAVDLPGGDINTDGGEVLLRMEQRLDYGEEFARLPIINTPGGSELRVEDIAEVEDGFEESDRDMLYNGQPAVTIEVSRIGDQTPISVQEAVSEELDTLSGTLPEGVDVTIYNNRADTYRERADLMLKNGAMGLVLVIILLGIFLEARLAFWVMMGIPISFLGSFILLPIFGVSLNMMSMFGFIIALGIVVDDAIVVGENVYQYHQQGVPFARAAVRGTREVAVPVTFSILTNIAAFLPIYFIPGTTGKIFGIIPVVVICAFLISLGECLFILPAHLGHHGERSHNRASQWLHNAQQKFSHAFKEWVRHRYGPFLDFVLRHRYLAFVLAFCILALGLAYAGSGRMGMGLFPDTESDFAEAEIEFPYGSPTARTQEATDRFVDAAREVIENSGHDELMEGVLVDIGRGGGHAARVRVLLADPEVRDRTMGTETFARKWRERVGEIPGAEFVKFHFAGGGPGHRSPVSVELRHRNIDVLRKVSSRIADRLAEFPNVSDISDGFQPGKPQVDFAMRSGGKALNLTAQEVGRQVRDAFYGARAIRQLRGRDEVDVRVKLPEEERSSEFYLENFEVRTPKGVLVPLQDVADSARGRSYMSIDRRNGQRVIQVTADVTPRSEAGQVIETLEQDIIPALQKQYPELDYGFEGMQADISESMGSLRVTFILALLAIYAMLAVPFRSYVQPLIVMLSIPFGIVGAVAGHLIMGYSMSVISLFGVVALAGVVVNDSLILVTFANRARESGSDPRTAIHEAAIQRFRPILLTSLTTFGGLAPLMFETSRQARMMIPMAISLGFGILFALAITLAIVPILYMTIIDVQRLFRQES